MGNSLVTVYEYATYYGLSSYNTSQIQSYLDYSSDLIKTYCDRDFEKKDYQEWYNSDSFDVQLSEYPINRLYFVKPIDNLATITSTNTALEQIFEKDVNNIYITLDDITETYPISSYNTLGTLSASLITSGIDIKLNVSELFPTNYIKDQTSDLNNIQLVGASLKNIKANIDKSTKRTIILDEACTDLFIKYNAGYTFSQDTSGHDALSVIGNVPNDLKNVCINLTKDIAAVTTVSYNANGTPSLLFKSETIGDYSYDRGDSGFQASYFLNKYVANEENGGISVLDFYRKKSF